MTAKPPDCPIELSFNISETSGLYSQLAGVLAGFAFVALFFLITDARKRYLKSTEQIPRLGVSVFISLVLVSVSYALLAGETANSGRAATIELVVALGFIVAGTGLFHLIHQLIVGVKSSGVLPVGGDDAAASTVRSMLSYAFPVILLSTLLGGMDDYNDIRFPPPPYRAPLAGNWNRDQLDLIAALCLVAGLAIPPLVRWLPIPRYTDQYKADRARVWITHAIPLLAAGSTIVAFVFSAKYGICDTMPEWMAITAVAVPTIFLICSSTHLIRSR